MRHVEKGKRQITQEVKIGTNAFYVQNFARRRNGVVWRRLGLCLDSRWVALESIVACRNRFWPINVMFNFPLPESILISRIDSRISENFLFFVRITLKELPNINHFTSKLILTKSILSIINSIKAEPNTH